MSEQCQHETFRCDCKVGRLTEEEGGPVTSWVLEVSVSCVNCGQEFGFLGPPGGIRNHEPTTSPDGLELRIPIVPGPVPRTGKQFYEFPERLKPRRHHA